MDNILVVNSQVNSMAGNIFTEQTHDRSANITEKVRGRNIFNSEVRSLTEAAERMVSIGDGQAALIPMVCDLLDRAVQYNDCIQVSHGGKGWWSTQCCYAKRKTNCNFEDFYFTHNSPQI